MLPWSQCHIVVSIRVSPALRLISAPGGTDVDEADALSWRSEEVDIYSNSWGPEDSGTAVMGPGELLEMVFETSTREAGGYHVELHACGVTGMWLSHIGTCMWLSHRVTCMWLSHSIDGATGTAGTAIAVPLFRRKTT